MRKKKAVEDDLDFVQVQPGDEVAYGNWNNWDAVAAPKWEDMGLNEPLKAPDPAPVVEQIVQLEDKKNGFRKRAERLFSNPIPTHLSRWVIGHGKTYREWPDEICHAQLKSIPKDVNLFASNFDVKPGYEVEGLSYWKWMTGPLSPWRCLFEHGTPEKLFFNEDKDGKKRISGFVMNNVDIVDPKKTTLVYNYCIAMRMIGEYSEYIRSWHYFHDMGVPPHLALYLGRMFRPVLNEPELVTMDQRNDGCHWPLWFSGAEYDYSRSEYKNSRIINFDRLKNANPTFDGKSCNQWCDKYRHKRGESAFSDFTVKVKEQIVSKGRFSKVRGYPVKDILNEFFKWVEEHQAKLAEYGEKA